MSIIEEKLNEMVNLKEEIEMKREELDEMELDPDDYIEQYEDMLKECYTEKGDGNIYIGNLCYNIAHVLKKVDPIAYRCGLTEYVDSVDITETADYNELEEEISDMELELDNLIMDFSNDYNIEEEEIELYIEKEMGR